MSKKLSDILHSEKCWTKSFSARNKFGVHCEPDDPVATRFCLAGLDIAYGLCHLLDFLLHNAEIGPSQHNSIRVKLSNMVGDYPYMYPRTEEGAKLRRRYCLRQARLLTKKKARAKERRTDR